MPSPTLETVGLTKRFGELTALDHLDLKLEGAKCVGFLGPNGAGKTTTLKLLSDMIFPTEGACYLNGIDVQEERKRALADAGVLIETPEIYPSLTPNQALEMVADLRGVPRAEHAERAAEVLEEVKMTEWADQPVGRFSKGMKQRINIAAALVHDPAIVILDEPATGLDPRGMTEVREIVRNLKQRNRLVFMSSHILQEVTDVCDEVALIDHGKLLFYDTLENVTARFSAGRAVLTAHLAHPADSGDVEARVGALDGVVATRLEDPRRLRIEFEGDDEAQATLLTDLVGLRLGLMDLRAEDALEDIYLRQIERGD